MDTHTYTPVLLRISRLISYMPPLTHVRYSMTRVHQQSCFSHIQLIATLWTVACGAPCNSPGKNTGGGYHTFFQEVFPTQGYQILISYVSCIDRWVLYHQCYLGSPDWYEDLGKLIKVVTDHHLLSSTVSFMFSVAYNNILSKSYFLTYSGNGALLKIHTKAYFSSVHWTVCFPITVILRYIFISGREETSSSSALDSIIYTINTSR